MNDASYFDSFFNHQKKTIVIFNYLQNSADYDMDKNIEIVDEWNSSSKELVKYLKCSKLTSFSKALQLAFEIYEKNLNKINELGQSLSLITYVNHSFIINSSKIENSFSICQLVLKLHDECFQILTSKIHPTPSIQLKKFPSYITETLMGFFINSFFPTPEQIRELSKKTNLTEIQIQNWFKNRRKRDKKFLILLSFPSKNPLLSNPHIHSYIPNYDDQIINVSSSIRELSMSEDDQNDWEKLFYSNK